LPACDTAGALNEWNDSAGAMVERKQKQRRAVTLLELVAVVTLIGIMASVAMFRIGTAGVGDFGAQGIARRIAMDMKIARRAAISTGDNHYLSFTVVDGAVTNYRLYRKASGGDVTADALRSIPSEVTVTVSATKAEFNFEGEALGAYTVTLAGPNRSWQLTTVPVTGSVRMTEL
jgi:prepilin-type N-terminal cleavage/methylation domain-containing protein